MVARRSEARLVRLVRVALESVPVRGEHLLVAVSGGPDSTALLAALGELAAVCDLRLTAAYVDHGLRGVEGEREAVAVRALAERTGAGFVVRAVALVAGADLEARARQARYAALAALADEVGATRIATGHTRDDQVETVLLHLLRGAGRRGLGGMRPVRGRVLRPLLAASRTDVRRYLAERDLAFSIDRTNADLRLTRNRVRRLLVPFLETEFNARLGPAVAALAARLRDEDTYLARMAAARAAVHVDGDVLRTSVAGEPLALARRIVRRWLGPHATAAHVERVLVLARGGRGAVGLPGPARVVREGAVLVKRAGRRATALHWALDVAPGTSVMHPGGAWRLTLSSPRAWTTADTLPPPVAAVFDADALPAGLVVRPPAPGDRVRLVQGGTRKLQDLLVDAKVPRERRADVAVLVAGDDVLWIPGLARGATAAVTPATRRVVEGVLGRDV